MTIGNYEILSREEVKYRGYAAVRLSVQFDWSAEPAEVMFVPKLHQIELFHSGSGVGSTPEQMYEIKAASSIEEGLSYFV